MVVTTKEWQIFYDFIKNPQSIDILKLADELDFSDVRIPDTFAKAMTIAVKNSPNHHAMSNAILVWAKESNYTVYSYCIKALVALLIAVADEKCLLKEMD